MGKYGANVVYIYKLEFLIYKFGISEWYLV